MFEGFLPVLSLFMLLAVAVLALASKDRTTGRMRDTTAPVSTRARDGNPGGVGFLRILTERIDDPRDRLRRRPLLQESAWDQRVGRTRY